MAEFCAGFVKFRARAALSDALKIKLGATLVGTEGDSLLFVARAEHRGAAAAAGLEIAEQRVLPMEAFIYLSEGTR